MTNDTTAVTYWQQLRFYCRKPANIDIYIAEAGRKRVGYLLLRHEASTTLITEAVDEESRGMGVATSMICHAQKLCADLTAEILASNMPSIKLHESTGFRLDREDAHAKIYRYGRATVTDGK